MSCLWNSDQNGGPWGLGVVGWGLMVVRVQVQGVVGVGGWLGERLAVVGWGF